MRHLLSTLCTLLAALLAAAALAGAQIDQLLRDQEPVQQIAGDLPAQERFSEAMVALMVDELTDQDPDALPSGVQATISDIASSMLEDERILEAWDDSLQATRQDLEAELERLFHDGGTGSPEDLTVALDLSPVAAAMTEPLRESLDGLLGWLPFLDDSSFDALAPEVIVDLDAVAEDGVDPYQWAAAAEASRHWPVLAGAAGVLALAGVLIGLGRGRWAALSLGGLLGVVLGAGVALTAASPDLTPHQPVPQAVGALLEHVQVGFTDWAQPAWWIFTGACGAVVVLGLLGATLTRHRTADRGRGQAGHDELLRV
ncbi:hypothetical protein [Nesterenkonia suensis]